MFSKRQTVAYRRLTSFYSQVWLKCGACRILWQTASSGVTLDTPQGNKTTCPVCFLLGHLDKVV